MPFEKTINADDMNDDNLKKAAEGMMFVVEVFVKSHMEIFRFASSDRPEEKQFGSPWWVTLTPFQALQTRSQSTRRPLSEVARECLAVEDDPAALKPWETINKMDVLLSARATTILSAWSGTPRTQSRKGYSTNAYATNAYLGSNVPDRSITQVFIPGLEKHWRTVLGQVTLSRGQ